MKRFYICAATALLMSSPLAHAGKNDIDLGAITGVNTAFKALSEDLTSALSYKAVAPAEPLGLTGFDIGLELTTTKMGKASDWAAAVPGTDKLDTLPVPKLHAHKGLPLDIDVGLMYTAIPTTNIKLIGGELRYSFVSGNVAIPAIAVRGTYSKLSGVSDLDFSTKGLELTVSKGFAMITPYAGVGAVWSTSDAAAATNLKKVDTQQSKWYIGGNINLGLMNIALESDTTGGNASYSAKLGIRF